MKYDSWSDFKFFVVGASLAAGRSIWVGDDGQDNKYIKTLSDTGESGNEVRTVAREVDGVAQIIRR